MAALKMTAMELETASGSTFIAPYCILRLYEYLGDREKQLYWLQQMYDLKDPSLPYYGIKTNNPIQQDPAYVKIMEQLGLW
jgi:hypothetical protein